MKQPPFSDWRPLVPAGLVFIVGTVNIVSAVTPALSQRLAILTQFFPLEVPDYSRLFVLVSGLIFYILAYYLVRQSWLAWALTLVLLVLSSVGHLLKGIDYEEVLVSLLAGLLLWQTRKSFYRRASLPSINNAFRLFIYSLGALFAYGTIGFLLFDDRYFGREFSLAQALHNSFLLYFTFNVPNVVPKTLFGHLFLNSAAVVGSLFYIYIFAILFAPVLFRLPERSAARRRAQRLIELAGTDTLDKLKSSSDKHIFFYGEGHACIGFGIAQGSIVALGDPIAADISLGTETIKALHDAAQENGWRLAFFQTKSDYHEIYKSLGYKILEIGRDAIVDLQTFSLEGSAMKSLRNSLTQLERHGLKVEFLTPPFSRPVWQELAAINRDWQTIPGRHERGFTQSSFGTNLAADAIAIARDASGQALAFLSLLTYPRIGILAVDLIRRKADIAHGVMDFLFVSMFNHYRTAGYQKCDLGLAPLAGAETVAIDHWLNNVLAISYNRLGWLFNFHGLKKFKAKFNPNWEPRYLVYRSETNLAPLGIALLKLTRLSPTKLD